MAILPHDSYDLSCPAFEYFPASRLYGPAFRAVTGAGYGSFADMAPWPGKHVCVSFPRHYDDQAARLNGVQAGAENGVEETCRILSDLL